MLGIKKLSIIQLYTLTINTMKYYYYDHEDAFYRSDSHDEKYLKFVGKPEFKAPPKTTLVSEILRFGIEITKAQYDKGEPVSE